MFGNNNGFGNFNNNVLNNNLGAAGGFTGLPQGGIGGGFDLGVGGVAAGGFNAGFAAQGPLTDLDFNDNPLMPVDQQSVQNVSIRKVFLTMTRRQKSQWRRNYEITATGATLNSIADAVSQCGGMGVRNETITGLMADQAVTGPSLFSYMGSPEANVGIENGWDEHRFRFVIVADVFMNGKYRKTEFISGYTDEPAVVNGALENSRAISPNMLFVINNVSEATVKRMHDTGGVREFTTLSATNAIIRDDRYSLSGNNNLWVIRPEDVLGTIDKLPLIDGMMQAAEFGEQPTHADLDTQLTGIPKMAARSSDMLTTYTSRLINGAVSARLGTNDLLNEDGVQSGEFAASRVREKLFSRGAFAFALNKKCGTNTVTTATFTYGDLLRLDPTIDSRVSVFMKAYDNTPGLIVPDGTSVADIADASQHCVAATMVANSLMSLMSQAGITLLVYNASNEEFGSFSVVPAFDGMDTDGLLASRVETLKQRMQTEVLDIMSLNGALPYKVDVIADVYNDVFVKLRLDGEERHYVVPAFASSHMAPTVTNDQTRLIDFARSMSDLVDTCVDRTNHPVQQNNVGGFATGNAGVGQFGVGNY